MKKVLAMTVAAALFAGCQTDEPATPAKPVNKPVAAVDAGKTAAPPKAPSAKEYYEVNKAGKIYVFGKLDSVIDFRSKGTVPAGMIEKPAMGPAGEAVMFQAGDGMEAGLMAEFAKAHPKK